jgi:DNA polymerase alpha subunit A
VALNLKTVINHKKNVNEIAAASVLWCQKVRIEGPMTQGDWNTPGQMRHFSVVRKLDGGTFPIGWEDKVTEENSKPVAKRNGGLVLSAQSSERGLLGFLLARLHQIDADVLVGHNIGGFDLDVLLHRLKECKVTHWSRIGRLRRSKMPFLTKDNQVIVMSDIDILA